MESEKLLKKVFCPVLALVFRCNKDNIWLSVETVKEDHILMSIAWDCMNKPEFKGLFDDICSKIDSIYNIKNDKVKIRNIIKLLGHEKNKLVIFEMALSVKTIFEKEKAEFNNYIYSVIRINTDLSFLQDKRQYDKLYNYLFTDNKVYGLNNKIWDFIIDIYYDSVEREYDVFSFFKCEVSYGD